ncbi:hypothetical protein Tco_0273891 [Tanacetum coccineum]
MCTMCKKQHNQSACPSKPEGLQELKSVYKRLRLSFAWWWEIDYNRGMCLQEEPKCLQEVGEVVSTRSKSDCKGGKVTASPSTPIMLRVGMWIRSPVKEKSSNEDRTINGKVVRIENMIGFKVKVIAFSVTQFLGYQQRIAGETWLDE